MTYDILWGLLKSDYALIDTSRLSGIATSMQPFISQVFVFNP